MPKMEQEEIGQHVGEIKTVSWGIAGTTEGEKFIYIDEQNTEDGGDGQTVFIPQIAVALFLESIRKIAEQNEESNV